MNLSLNEILTLRSDRSKDLGWSGSLLDLLFLLVSFLLLFLSLLVESLLVLLRDRLWFGSTLLNNDWRFMSSWLVGLSLVEVVDNLHPSVVLSLLFGIDDSLFSVSCLLLLLFSVLKLFVHGLEVDEGHGVLRWLSDNLLLESVSFSSGVFTIIDDSGELIGVEETLIVVQVFFSLDQGMMLNLWFGLRNDSSLTRSLDQLNDSVVSERTPVMVMVSMLDSETFRASE